MRNPYSVTSFDLVRRLIGLVVLVGELAYHIQGLLFRHHLLNGFPPPLGGGGFTGPVLVPLYRPIPLGPLYGLTPLRDWSALWEYPNVPGFGLKALLIIPRVGLTAPDGLP